MVGFLILVIGPRECPNVSHLGLIILTILGSIEDEGKDILFEDSPLTLIFPSS
jgi:hypothetical protein